MAEVKTKHQLITALDDVVEAIHAVYQNMETLNGAMQGVKETQLEETLSGVIHNEDERNNMLVGLEYVKEVHSLLPNVEDLDEVRDVCRNISQTLNNMQD